MTDIQKMSVAMNWLGMPYRERELKMADAQNKFTHIDVLRLAKQMLELGPLPPEHREHGEWCVWCAISLAKNNLDREYGVHLSLYELLTDPKAEIEYDEDMPLIGARHALDKWNAIDANTLTQSAAIEILDEAMTRS